MKLRALLINPWIYDFAAYNLWSRPLGLVRVAEDLDSFDTALTFIDCTDSVERKRFGTGRFRSERVEKPVLLKDVRRNYRRYGISTDQFVQRVRKSLPVDIVLMTCVMGYWYPGVQKATELVREIIKHPTLGAEILADLDFLGPALAFEQRPRDNLCAGCIGTG